jgi:hypothetical protein
MQFAAARHRQVDSRADMRKPPWPGRQGIGRPDAAVAAAGTRRPSPSSTAATCPRSASLFAAFPINTDDHPVDRVPGAAQLSAADRRRAAAVVRGPAPGANSSRQMQKLCPPARRPAACQSKRQPTAASLWPATTSTRPACGRCSATRPAARPNGRASLKTGDSRRVHQRCPVRRPRAQTASAKPMAFWSARSFSKASDLPHPMRKRVERSEQTAEKVGTFASIGPLGKASAPYCFPLSPSYSIRLRRIGATGMVSRALWRRLLYDRERAGP